MTIGWRVSRESRFLDLVSPGVHSTYGQHVFAAAEASKPLAVDAALLVDSCGAGHSAD